MRIRHVVLVTLLAATLAACGGPGDPSGTVDPDGSGAAIAVTDAWVRSNPNGMGAGYMVITSPQDDRLVAAAVDPSVAGAVEVHEVVMQDGSMRMREVDGGVPLPAGAAVELRPGGYHLMLLEMPAMLAAGTEVAVTLSFASGVELTVAAVVRADTPGSETTMPMHGGHGG